MSNINNTDAVRTQYSTSKNLDARGLLHKLYSTNKLGWTKWVFQNYDFKPNALLLELGCGNGAVWSASISEIPDDASIILSDLSQGMLDVAKKNLDGIQNIEYKIIDAQDICYGDNTFDVVIANHMLYHIPDRKKALREIARVLKPNGIFYATTNGMENMKELKTTVQNYDSQIDYPVYSVSQEFGLQNGEQQLKEFFGSVTIKGYEDSLHVTEAQPIVDYVLSFEGHGNVTEIITGDRVADFKKYMEKLLSSKGYIAISKEVGLFIAVDPLKY